MSHQRMTHLELPPPLESDHNLLDCIRFNIKSGSLQTHGQLVEYLIKVDNDTRHEISELWCYENIIDTLGAMDTTK